MKTNSNNIKITINPIFSFLLLYFFLMKIYTNNNRTKILNTTDTFKLNPSSIMTSFNLITAVETIKSLEKVPIVYKRN